MSDKDIDYSDIPELGKAFFQTRDSCPPGAKSHGDYARGPEGIGLVQSAGAWISNAD
jgi:hypothetical protein